MEKKANKAINFILKLLTAPYQKPLASAAKAGGSRVHKTRGPVSSGPGTRSTFAKGAPAKGKKSAGGYGVSLHTPSSVPPVIPKKAPKAGVGTPVKTSTKPKKTDKPGKADKSEKLHFWERKGDKGPKFSGAKTTGVGVGATALGAGIYTGAKDRADQLWNLLGIDHQRFGKDPNQGRDIGEMNLQPELLDRMAELAAGRDTSEGGNVQPSVSLAERFKGLTPNQRSLVLGVLGLGGGITGSRAYGAMTGKQSLLRDLGVGTASAAALAGGDRLLNKESSLEAVMDGMYQGYKRD